MNVIVSSRSCLNTQTSVSSKSALVYYKCQNSRKTVLSATVLGIPLHNDSDILVQILFNYFVPTGSLLEHVVDEGTVLTLVKVLLLTLLSLLHTTLGGVA